MYDSLITYINNQLSKPLTELEIDSLYDIFTLKKVRKHTFFLQEGEVCKVAGFITKGALKQYSIDDTGKENILSLLIENWWVGDRESFINGTPSPFFIDAYEDTEMLVISKEDYDNKLDKLPFMVELSRKVSERQAFQLLKRVHSTKAFSTEDRLSDLEKTYPEFFKRFPQHIIASYLGMTKETLSRIRNNHPNKKKIR